MRSEISIHVPAWGTTMSSGRIIRRPADFNPRSRVGNDMVAFGASAVFIISIHVPAWGTTVNKWVQKTYYQNFNPRSRVGNDWFAFLPLSLGAGFQSTFPRGDRPTQISPSPSFCKFQSTFPRGERRCLNNYNLDVILFQSTFPRGERLRRKWRRRPNV